MHRSTADSTGQPNQLETGSSMKIVAVPVVENATLCMGGQPSMCTAASYCATVVNGTSTELCGSCAEQVFMCGPNPHYQSAIGQCTCGRMHRSTADATGQPSQLKAGSPMITAVAVPVVENATLCMGGQPNMCSAASYCATAVNGTSTELCGSCAEQEFMCGPNPHYQSAIGQCTCGRMHRSTADATRQPSHLKTGSWMKTVVAVPVVENATLCIGGQPNMCIAASRCATAVNGTSTELCGACAKQEFMCGPNPNHQSVGQCTCGRMHRSGFLVGRW